MVLTHPTRSIGDGLDGLFWAVFEHSRVPMALVDRDRRYVEVNHAGLDLFQFSRDEVIGRRAGRTAIDDDGQLAAREWERLLRSNELYGESTIAHPSGTLMRVSYAAHGSVASGRWLALFVALSAHFEPDGAELIGTAEADEPRRNGLALTPREREVVRRVALGSSTRQIAADLYLSPATVRSHVRNAMVKTNAHTRAQLVAIVLGERLIAE